MKYIFFYHDAGKKMREKKFLNPFEPQAIQFRPSSLFGSAV